MSTDLARRRRTWMLTYVVAVAVAGALAWVTVGLPQSNRGSSDLAARVDSLRNESLDQLPVQLGTPVAVDTETTRYIVSQGEAAVPLLEKALDSDDPKQVGWAAYCLMRLNSEEGLSTAWWPQLILSVNAGDSVEEHFALGGLNRYFA